MEMKSLRDAEDNALDVNNPDRRDLIFIYENAVRDPHVHAQIEIARNKLTGEPFTVSRNGADDEQATDLFKREWFDKFIGFVLDSELWGYTLVELGDLDENGEFVDAITFPRRNVYPFMKAIALDPDAPAKGIFYEEQTDELFLIELGQADMLGTLQLVSREVIWKNFARTDWSQSSEKFGMPFLYIKTDTSNTAELDRLEAMARNFASNGYIIGDTEDEINIVQTPATDFYKIYAENATFCDAQISKAINGQTGSSDEKAFVGAAEVHERILDDFHAARLRRATNIVNNKLIPFLVYHGYPLEGCKLRYNAFDPKPEAKPEAPDDGNGKDPKPETHEKAKPGKPQAARRSLPW